MPAPAAPTGLVATTTDPTEVDLAWAEAQSPDAPTSLEVWRDDGLAGTSVLLATLGALVVTYDDTTTHAGRDYIYKVRAHNADGYSAYTTLTVSTHAVAYGYQISLADKLYMLRSGTNFKSEQPIGSAPQIGTRVDLSPVKKWVQNDWRGGLGQKRWQDAQMYDDGAVDSFTDPHKLGCLPQLNKVTTALATTFLQQGVDMKFEVRALNDSANAALYIALQSLHDTSGEVWKLPNTTGSLSRITADSLKHFSAILNSFHDDPHGLLVGTSQESGSAAGHLFKYPGGSDTIGGTALTNKYDGSGGTFSFPRITCLCNFNDADYIGTGNSTNGAAVYRMSAGAQWTISLFKDINCHYI